MKSIFAILMLALSFSSAWAKDDTILRPGESISIGDRRILCDSQSLGKVAYCSCDKSFWGGSACLNYRVFNKDTGVDSVVRKFSCFKNLDFGACKAAMADIAICQSLSFED